MLQNSLYNAVGSLIRIGIAIVSIPLLIRLIGISEYGLWTLATAAIALVTLAEGGLSISTTVFASKDLTNKDDRGLAETLTITIGLMLILATLAGSITWFGAETYSNLFLNLSSAERSVVIQAMQIGSVAVWAKLLQQVLTGLLQAFQRYDFINIANTLHALFTQGGLVCIAWLGGRSVAMMFWFSIINVVILLLYIGFSWLLLRDRHLNLVVTRIKVSTIGRYSILTWFSTLGNQLFSQGDRLIVGSLLGTGPLGVYAAVTTITSQITAVSGITVNPLLPKISAAWSERKTSTNRLYHDLEQATQINGFMTLGFGAFLFSLAPLLLQLAIGETATPENVLVFQVAIVIYTIYSLNVVGYYTLFGIGKVTANLLINLFSGAFSLFLIYVGCLNYGLLGAIAGNAGYLLSLLFVFWGMKYVDIAVSHWFRWLSVPFIWYILVVAANSQFSGNIVLLTSMFALQLIVLVTWFWRVQKLDYHLMLRKVRYLMMSSK